MEALGDYNVFADGLTIYTTLDPNAQEYVEKMLAPKKQMKSLISQMMISSGNRLTRYKNRRNSRDWRQSLPRYKTWNKFCHNT
ncbi:hypothetical protein ACI2OX_10970 [Bacillus sp. N9]